MNSRNFPGPRVAPASLVKIFGLALALSFATTTEPALAGHRSTNHPGKPAAAKSCPELGKGIAFYNAGKYKDALPYLQYASRKTPLDWQTHYYLGHTLLLLGQKSDAVTEYRYCMGCNPSANIVSNCQNAILGIYPQAGQSTEFNAYTDNSVLMKPVKNPMSGDRQSALQFKKDRVMMEMEEEERRINRERAATQANLEKSPYVPLIERSPTPGLNNNVIPDPSFARPITEMTDKQMKAMKEEYKKRAENVK